ncbi:MAG: acetyl-CoA carboxylase biotin carboxyl carrier protein [Zetaproteobacteria bacterium]|nr:acetyl-CoA carboxylase biotin carboxyl carrier protein [Zetaproteobacteria bacterium]
MADLDKIERLMQLVRKYGFGKFELKEDDYSFKFEDIRESQPLQPALQAPMSHPFQTLSPPVPSPSYENPVATPKESIDHNSRTSANIKEIRSPFVGTFYASPSPTASPFAVPGQNIRKGDTLCIVEAMKLMNEIESEYTGTVREVLVDNESPIEFDQILFKVEVNS